MAARTLFGSARLHSVRSLLRRRGRQGQYMAGGSTEIWRSPLEWQTSPERMPWREARRPAACALQGSDHLDAAALDEVGAARGAESEHDVDLCAGVPRRSVANAQGEMVLAVDRERLKRLWDRLP